ncbi:MAG: hypothetical protein AB1721_01115 [Patescibacteria group bacterium]
MAIVVKRKEGETESSFLYRASKRIQKSGILLEARRNRFHHKTLSKNKVKAKAKHSLAMGKLIRKQLKFGYSPEEAVAMAKRILKGITRK